MDPGPKVRPDPEQLAGVPLFESLSSEQLRAIASLTLRPSRATFRRSPSA